VPDVSVLTTSQLSGDDRAELRRLIDEAFAGGFTDDDWAHALGGWHAVIRAGGRVVAHAAVVERRIWVGARAVRAGYVEAVAVRPPLQGRGLGSAVMAALDPLIRDRFDLGVLSSGEWSFYERLGWERWRGPTFVRDAAGVAQRSPDDDDGVMVLRRTPGDGLDLAAPITCDARSGDAW
jgi:aminoglycoside 2'-N-acetyltransferase I